MLFSHAAYGLRILAGTPIPGPLGSGQSGATDIVVRLRETEIFPSVIPSEFSYVSPAGDGQDMPALRVAELAGGSYYGFFYRDGVRFAVEREGREIWMDWPDSSSLEDATTYLLGPVLGFVLRLRGIAPLHASAVAVGDRAIAIVGEGGAGKSTTAASFARLGYAVLSDDVVALTDKGGCFLAEPGYPRVNLWPDSARALFGSEDALPRITPTWDKRFLALDQSGFRFESRPLPLSAIYVLGLREPGVPLITIKALLPPAAMMTLVANSYVNYLLDAPMRRTEFEILSRLVSTVPVRSVEPSNELCANDLCEAIAADASDLISPQSAAVSSEQS